MTISVETLKVWGNRALVLTAVGSLMILEFAQKTLGVSLIKSAKLIKECTMNGIEVGTPEKYKISLKDSLM